MLAPSGGLAERLKAPVLKTGKGSRPSRVRIPDPPPILVCAAHGQASCLSGLSGNSIVLAGYEYDIPVCCTKTHSFIQPHELWGEAFERFSQTQPDCIVLFNDNL